MQGSRDGVIRHLLDEYPHIAGLEPFVRPIPTRLKTTFRLELLGEGAAREAIQRPAKDTGVDFTDAAAQKLVDNLLARSEKRRGVTWGAEGYGETTVEFQIVERDGYLYLDS